MNESMYKKFFEVQSKHWWFSTRKKIVLDIIATDKKYAGKKTILDVGCGSGVMLNALQNEGQTSGMDMSDDAINFCKEIFTGEVKKGFLPDGVPYELNQFNLITALDVIEHIDRDTESLSAMHSLLVEGGRAIVTVPAYMFLWSKFDELNEHKRRYTLPELRTKLIEAGFKVEKISYFNTLLFPVVFTVRMLNNFLNRDGASDVDLPSPFINFILSKIFSIEQYLLRSVNLPFGVSILAIVKK